MGRKLLKEMMAKISQSYENDKPTNPRSSTEPQHKKHEESNTKEYHKLFCFQTSDKEKTLKAARGKNTGHVDKTHILVRMTGRLLVRNNEAIRQWRNIFRKWIHGTVKHEKQMIRQRKNSQSIILYPAKISTKTGDIFKHTKAEVGERGSKRNSSTAGLHYNKC